MVCIFYKKYAVPRKCLREGWVNPECRLEITMAPDNSDGFLITDALPKTKDEKSQDALVILFG